MHWPHIYKMQRQSPDRFRQYTLNMMRIRQKQEMYNEVNDHPLRQWIYQWTPRGGGALGECISDRFEWECRRCVDPDPDDHCHICHAFTTPQPDTPAARYLPRHPLPPKQYARCQYCMCIVCPKCVRVFDEVCPRCADPSRERLSVTKHDTWWT